jgi:hypothetical protein
LPPRLRETRESIVADATQLAIEIGGLRRQLRERGDDRGVFVGSAAAPFHALYAPPCGSRRS